MKTKRELNICDIENWLDFMPDRDIQQIRDQCKRLIDAVPMALTNNEDDPEPGQQQ